MYGGESFSIKRFIYTQNSKNIFSSKVICVGAPRLHEYLKTNFPSIQIKSVILDIDSRLKTFFDTNEYFEYNMLNDYYFDGPEKRSLFEEFLRETKYN